LKALIDGDVVCYMACKPRLEKPIHDDLVITTLEDDGEEIGYSYTEEEDAEYLEQCWSSVEEIIQEALINTFTTEYKMAVKGNGNYREDIFPDYKNHRRRQPNPLYPIVKALRLRMVERGMAVAADGMEADDYLRIWSKEYDDEGFVVCSIDKDLLMIPGAHYNLKKKTLVQINDAEGMRRYYEQLLSGDPTDAIQGLWKVGPVKAKKMLEDCVTHDDFQEAVVSNYLAIQGEETWKDHLQLTGSLIYLLKSLEDRFDVMKWPLVRELTL
jgi:5'-3' exonuclease